METLARPHVRRLLFAMNGIFLAGVGAVQMVFELLSHFAAAGPYGETFTNSIYTIGFLEAHGLALIFGILLLREARKTATDRSWHASAVAVHVLLGGANLLFWDAFHQMDMVPAGVIATTLHALFLVLHGASLVTVARPDPRRA